MLKIGNFWYFLFILLTAGITVGLYYLFRNKSLKAKKILIGSMVVFNLFLHFFKLLFPPYSTDVNVAAESVGFVNICAVSVLTFPFFFFSKSESAKDWMFYIGAISGFLALAYPTEAINTPILSFDLWRFYICHIIIFVAPLLMLMLKVHKLNYHNIWKMPIYMAAVLLFIICNQVLQSELGIISLRGGDLLQAGCGYRNSSQIWGPTDAVSVMFTWLTPDFMKVVPFGPLAGQPKYWPFFYLLPGDLVYFTTIPFLLSMIWEHKHLKEDFIKLKEKIKLNKKDSK